MFYLQISLVYRLRDSTITGTVMSIIMIAQTMMGEFVLKFSARRVPFVSKLSEKHDKKFYKLLER